ncbi:hypothetical protein, partial [Burkholderia thailandensis]|uniref:hypothetical protein n=1 Tax=Burkholderia thailandensis TaxID=57975 RepID=UPI00217E21CD
NDRSQDGLRLRISIAGGHAYRALPHGDVLGSTHASADAKLVHTLPAGACGIVLPTVGIDADD